MSIEYENARQMAPEDVAAVTLNKQIIQIVGATEALLTFGPSVRVVYLSADVGSFRVRPGDYVNRTFVDGDVTVGTDTINIASHGYDTGEGPLRLVNAGGALPAGLAIDTDYWIIRVDDDNFQLAASFADATALTPVPVDITAAAGGGTHSIGGPATGWATALNPAATDLTGYGAVLVGEGAVVAISAPTQLTIKGFNAADVMTIWEAGG